MRLRLLLLLALLAGPLGAGAQSARVGAASAPGGTLLGRVCLDVDGDGACGEADPGIPGARIRLEDGRRLTVDEEGRFHAVEIDGRLQRGGRTAYGAHAVALDGFGLSRRFELAEGGAASVDLAVPATAAPEPDRTEGPAGEGVPRIGNEGIAWRIGGVGPPRGRVTVGEAEGSIGEDGRWSLEVALAEGPNALSVAVGDRSGGVTLWALSVHASRPAGGAPRLYPSRAVRLATLTVRPAAEGLAVTGRASAGVALHVGGRAVRTAADGRFGAVGFGEVVAVRASAAGLTAETLLTVAPSERAFSGVLLGELELQAGPGAGVVLSGRVAGSASARLRGFTVEAGLDLDDRDRDPLDLTSPRDALARAVQPDPARVVLDAGDAATVEDGNPGRGRLWARAEGHGLRLDVGAGRTSLSEGELGRHDRAFFGVRAAQRLAIGPGALEAVVVGERAAADVQGLGAGVPGQDLLAATGGSLYYLSRRNLVAGSERVRVEWRDPASQLTVATAELRRGRDYDLDPVGGRLLLARPLASRRPVAALVGGDPFASAEAWLRVEYLRLDGVAAERGLVGGEVRGGVGPVSLSVGAIQESRPGPDWRLAHAAAAVDVGAPLRIDVGVARSDGRLFGEDGGGRLASVDGGFGFGGAPGNAGPAAAFQVGAAGALGPSRWRGWWRERPAGYSDGTFDERVAARERGALVEGGAGPVALRLAWVERAGSDPYDPEGLLRREQGRAYGAASLGVGPVRLTLEALHERASSPSPGRQSAGGIGARWAPTPGLGLEVAHLQAFGVTGEVEARTFTSAGASLQTKDGALSLRAGWGPELGPRVLLSGARGLGDDGEEIYGTLALDRAGLGTEGGRGSAVGGRQRLASGSLFTEERVAYDARGLVVGRVVGASLAPAPGLTLVLSGERGERRAGGAAVARSVGGASAAWSVGPLRLDGRGELRVEGGDDQWLAGGGVEWRASPRLTLHARAFATDGAIGGRRARGGEGWLGSAWRSERLSLLARLGRVVDDRPGALDRDASIASLTLTARVLPRARVGATVLGALQRLGGGADDRLAASLRGEVALFGPTDVAVEYARRGSLAGRELGDVDAWRLEAGIEERGVRLALGYTVVGFTGTGIDPEEREGRFYLRALLVR